MSVRAYLVIFQFWILSLLRIYLYVPTATLTPCGTLWLVVFLCFDFGLSYSIATHYANIDEAREKARGEDVVQPHCVVRFSV